jgi:hypothetical protein
MLRHILFLFLAVALPLLGDESGPPISITSPDTATTYVYGTIKSRSLHWSDAKQMLSAEVSFVDERQDSLQSTEDAHSFQLPGITLDKAHGIFYATTSKGEVIPVARRKKTLFLSTIEVLPNAVVRINHHRGNVTVILEAIRPDDVAKEQHKQDGATDPDATHNVDLHQLLP